MKAQPIEKVIKRSKAMEILGVGCSRTLRRWENKGLLTPIKRNCRVTVYLESEIEKLKTGNISFAR